MILEFYKEGSCWDYFDCNFCKPMPNPFDRTTYEAPCDQIITRIAGKCDSPGIDIKLCIESKRFNLTRDITHWSDSFENDRSKICKKFSCHDRNDYDFTKAIISSINASIAASPG